MKSVPALPSVVMTFFSITKGRDPQFHQRSEHLPGRVSELTWHRHSSVAGGIAWQGKLLLYFTNASFLFLDQSKKFYKLPDGSKITIGSERFTCPEAMFQPKIMDSNNEFTGIHEATCKAILNCDLDLRDKIS